MHSLCIPVVVKRTGTNNIAQKWDKTVWQMGKTVRHLGPKLSFRHFGTSAIVSGQFGPTKPVPKCPRYKVS